MQALCHVAREHGAEADLLAAVHEVNERQKRLLVEKIRFRFKDGVAGREFALWGAAFKPNTDDIREAPALNTIHGILEAGGRVRAHDPKALDNLRGEFGDRITYHEDAYETAEGADALVICTEWNEFRSPDFGRLQALLKQPVIFDGRNLYTPAQMKRLGFEYYSIGRPPVC